eukprot:jgi/Botrbrau1/1321/Bobra.0063s0036.1
MFSTKRPSCAYHRAGELPNGKQYCSRRLLNLFMGILNCRRPCERLIYFTLYF